MSESAVVVKDDMRRMITVGLVALRIVIGLVFVVSGLAKMWDIYGFMEIVKSYGFLPESLVVPVSIIIPFVEFALGLMLLLNYRPYSASLLLLGMVVIFTGFSAKRYLAGNASDCGCFGETIKDVIEWKYFARNSVLVFGLLINGVSRSERHKRITKKGGMENDE